MSALFIYLLKANIALCLFYLAYRLGLRRMTFYTLNRFFLLGGIAFSSMFPLVDVNDFFSRNEKLAQQVVTYVPDWTTLQQVQSFTVWTLVEWTFWAGVAVMAIRLLVQLVSLLVLHLRTVPDRLYGQEVRRMKGSLTPFSFFRKIYINPELHSASELYSIVRHEQVHVKEWHTADIMMGEVNNVFYWFNPGAWLMKSAIRENLEFLADRSILRSGINRKEYQYSLIQVNAAQYAAGITNSFNLSHIKNRIFMMNKSRTSGIQLYRYGVLCSIVCGLLLTLNYTKAGAVVTDAIQEVRTVLVPEKPEKRDTVPAEKTAVVEKAAARKDTFKIVKGKFGQADTFRRSSGSVIPAYDVMIAQREPAKTTGTYAGVVVSERQKSNTSASTTPNIIIGRPTENPPLIVVDGNVMPRSANVLAKMNASDIESVTVLKDQGATAIYGKAAEHGVIIITTKTGKPTWQRGARTVEGRLIHKPDSLKVVTVTGFRGSPAEYRTITVVTDTTDKLRRMYEKAGDMESALDEHLNQHQSAVRKNQARSPYTPEEYTRMFEEKVAEMTRRDSVLVMRGYSKTGQTIGQSVQTEHYPNPTDGQVNFAYSLSRPGKGAIRVTDMNGKVIWYKSINGLSGSQKEQINLANQPAGTYIINLTHDRSTMTSRIVKQ